MSRLSKIDAAGGSRDSPALAPRAARQKETRERVLGAALSLFGERGFDTVTTKEIAERAGVAAGTVFLVAKTKRELLVLAFHDRLEALLPVAIAAAKKKRGKPEARMVALLEPFLAFYEARPALSRAILEGSLFVDDDAMRGRGFLLTYRLIEELEALLAAAGAAPGEARALTAWSCFAIYFTSIVALLSGAQAEGAAHREHLRKTLALAIAAVVPP